MGSIWLTFWHNASHVNSLLSCQYLHCWLSWWKRLANFHQYPEACYWQQMVQTYFTISRLRNGLSDSFKIFYKARKMSLHHHQTVIISPPDCHYITTKLSLHHHTKLSLHHHHCQYITTSNSHYLITRLYPSINTYNN